MARLIHIDADMLESARGPMMRGPLPSTWKASAPREPAAVDVWFELTPRRPTVDSRVSASAGVGVAASMETYGGITGPGLGAAESTEVVLGGNPVLPGAPAPERPADFARQCTIRISVAAEGLAPGRQCLLVAALRGLGTDERAIVQTFIGHHNASEDAIVGDDRLAILVDAPRHGDLSFELRLRLAGTDPGTRLGVRGVTGYLL